MAIKLIDNKAIWNPVKRYPRNAPCVCNSGKKYKKCCEPHQPVVIGNENVKENEEITQFVKGMRQLFNR